jgi:hypothetical protein
MLYGPMVGSISVYAVAIFRDCDLDHTYDFRIVHLRSLPKLLPVLEGLFNGNELGDCISGVVVPGYKIDSGINPTASIHLMHECRNQRSPRLSSN